VLDALNMGVKDQIELPPEVAQQIPEGSPVRVILLFDSGEDESWRQLSLERFAGAYCEGDSVYEKPGSVSGCSTPRSGAYCEGDSVYEKLIDGPAAR
jgi:hypothetical protein